MYLMSHDAKKSIIHRLDPRTKITLLLITIPTTLLLDNYLILALLWSTTALLFLYKNTRALMFLTATLAVSWLFTMLLLFLVGSNGENMLYSLKFFLRFFTVSNMGFSLALTTSPNVLFRGLEKLKFPRPIILMLTLTCRFIVIFTEAGKNVVYSLRSRGVHLKVSSFIKEPTLIFRGIAIPLTICMVKTSRDLMSALEARAYGNSARTSLQEVEFRRVDWLFIVGFAAFSCTLIILGRLQYI